MLLATSYGISWTSFPKSGASSADQLAAQLEVCSIVTSEMDTLANQTLRATVDVEQEFGPDLIVTVQPNGWARFRLSNWPILRIVSAQFSPARMQPPFSWTAIPASALITEHTGLQPTGTIVPSGAGPGPTSVMIAPGYVDRSAGRKGFMVQVTTINGFPVAGIDRAAAAGATSVHVDDITGWWDPTLAAGARGTIHDPPWRETVTCAGATPDTAGAISGPGTLALASALQFPHTPAEGGTTSPDVAVLLTTMPSALLQAGFYLATHLGLMRGATAAVVQSARGTSVSGSGGQRWHDEAAKILARFARVF
jgi:hypothetical protein